MMWNKCTILSPVPDQNVLVINKKFKDFIPIKCYYEEETNEYISLESIALVPVSCTHWSEMPNYFNREKS